MSVRLVIQNLGWEKSRFDDLKERLIPYTKKIADLLDLKNNIIVHLYKNKNKEDLVRGEYDEGVIILYERTPDWRGDFTHELGHQFLPVGKIPITLKIKLNKIKEELEKNKGDGRIFLQEHTYSDPKEIWATFFKWYILGKVVDDGYLEVLDNYQPKAKKIVEKVLMSQDIIKANGHTAISEKEANRLFKGRLVFAPPVRVDLKKTIEPKKKRKQREYKINIQKDILSKPNYYNVFGFFKSKKFPLGSRRIHGGIMKEKTIRGWVPVEEQKQIEEEKNIFTIKKTGISDYDNMLKNKKYFEEKKGKKFEIVNITPEIYYKKLEDATDEVSSKLKEYLEEDKIKKYAKLMKGGTIFDMPVIDYSKEWFFQEGRHRIQAAKRIGIKKIPVMIITKMEKE